jgi:ankyrin repeat protein
VQHSKSYTRVRYCCCTTDRRTLLHVAAVSWRAADCVPLLLQQGVDPLALDASGRTALQLACLEQHCNTGTVQALLLAHTDSSSSASDSSSSSSSSSTSSSVITPMPAEMSTACLLCATAAGHADILTALLEHGCDPSGTVDAAGHTLLHVAAAWGKADCLGLLLQQGLSLHA